MRWPKGIVIPTSAEQNAFGKRGPIEPVTPGAWPRIPGYAIEPVEPWQVNEQSWVAVPLYEARPVKFFLCQGSLDFVAGGPPPEVRMPYGYAQLDVPWYKEIHQGSMEVTAGPWRTATLRRGEGLLTEMGEIVVAL